MTKLPPEAFALYVNLGISRSYATIAAHYGVTKRCVVHRATTEKWQDQLRVIEIEAKNNALKEAVEDIHKVNSRHLRSYMLLQAKALDYLLRNPIDSTSDAARILNLGILGERLVRGEPVHRREILLGRIEQLPEGLAEDVVREALADARN